MARTKVSTAAAYQKLIHSIRSTVIEARHKIERTTVSMYWTVGRSIEGYFKSPGGRALSSGQFYQRLSKDLKIDHRTLYEAAAFYRAYPKLDQTLALSWSHYRYLSQIENSDERAKWEQRIARGKLGVHAFQALLYQERQEKTPAPAKPLVAARGLLHHYRLVSARNVHTGTNELMVDCGFNNRIETPASGAVLVNKYIYRSLKEDGAYALKLTKAGTADIYTYLSLVERVVDGDTLLVNIDCGFGIFRQERLRLRGVDAPELNTIAGKAAKAFVEKELARVDFAVLKTYREDKYGRYLADVFILRGEKDPHVVAQKGELLNQKLIDAGLATMY